MAGEGILFDLLSILGIMNDLLLFFRLSALLTDNILNVILYMVKFITILEDNQ